MGAAAQLQEDASQDGAHGPRLGSGLSISITSTLHPIGALFFNRNTDSVWSVAGKGEYVKLGRCKIIPLSRAAEEALLEG